MGIFQTNGYTYQIHTRLIAELTNPPYLWGTATVETCLWQYIELWEQRSQEIYDPSNVIHLGKERLAKATRKLYALRHKAKFRDAALFPKNVEYLMETSTVHKLKNYTTMNKEAILRSEKKAKEAATRNIQLIYRWLQPIQPTLNRLTAQWSPDWLRYNAYSKKRKNRKRRLPPSNQPRLTEYLSLRQTFSKNTEIYNLLCLASRDCRSSMEQFSC